jgi:hypothetical protein
MAPQGFPRGGKQAGEGKIIRGGHVDELAAYRAQPFVHAGEHAPIPFVIDQADAGIARLKVANDVQAVVGRAVIDDDDLRRRGLLRHDCADRPRQHLAVVEVRGDDGETHASVRAGRPLLGFCLAQLITASQRFAT